jgi:RNA recognition motif-containing protein
MKKRLLNHSESSDKCDAVIHQEEDPVSETNDSTEEATTHRLESAHDSTEPSTSVDAPTTVYISGMPLKYCTEAVIEKIMSPYGTITRCSVHNTLKPYAFCDFAEPQQAADAIRAVHGRRLGGQSLMVRRAYRDNSTNSGRPQLVSSILQGSPKRQRQQLDSKIAAIQRKLAQQVSPYT